MKLNLRAPRAMQRRCLAAMSVLLLAAPSLRAGIVASDNFAYPDGHLGDQNGGTGWIIPWYTASNPEGGWEVAAGQVVSGFVPYSSYCGRWYNNPAATPELFISFDFSADDVQLNDTIAIYLYVGVNFTSLVMGKPPGGTDFRVGGSGLVPTGIAIVPHAAYHLIGVYDVDNARTAIWVNPDNTDFYNPTTGQNSADAVSPGSPGHVGSLLLVTYREGVGQLAGVRFDNLVIANTPDAVGLNGAPVLCNCLGDMNHDNIKDGRDIQSFTSCLITLGDCACADLNGLAGPDADDIPLFVNKLLTEQSCP